MTMPRNLIAACGMTALASGGGAFAQTPPTYDAQQLPVTKGVVAQYDLTPRGDVDGLILQDGTEIHLPPHLSTELAALVRPGSAVTVHGLKARSLPLVQALSITDDATGKTLTDTGPAGPAPGPRGPREPGVPLQAHGTIKALLHGPRGDFNGVLLDDGTMIHLPPPEAARLAGNLAPGKTIYATGDGTSNTLGVSIAAAEIGSNGNDMLQIVAHPHRPGPRPAPPQP